MKKTAITYAVFFLGLFVAGFCGYFLGRSQISRSNTLLESDVAKRPLTQIPKINTDQASSNNTFQTGSQTTARFELNPQTDLPGSIRELLSSKHTYPGPKILATLNHQDESQLIRQYAKENELTNKVSLTWALAAVGGDHSAELLSQTLTNSYGNRRLNRDENELMYSTIAALGVIAGRSDVAYEFLKVAARPGYWEQERKWLSPEAKQDSYAESALMSLCLQALGSSARPEMSDALNALAESNKQDALRLAGGIICGAFYYDYATANGAVATIDVVATGDAQRRYLKWRETENGKRWIAWFDKQLGRKKP